MSILDLFRPQPEIRVIRTPKGSIRVLEPPSDVLVSLRASLRFGFVGIRPPQQGADFGIVMQCGDEEAYAIKQQCVDLDEEAGVLQFKCNYMVIAGALKSYLGNGFGGLLMPVAYQRPKEGGRIEAGIAYFGRALPTGREAVDFQHQKPYDDYFGHGFRGMIGRFIEALAQSSSTTGFPLQSPIIGMDIRKRLQLGSIILGFLVHGPHLFCLRTRLDETDLAWEILSGSGVTEFYHLPSTPFAIDPDKLKIAKPESRSTA